MRIAVVGAGISGNLIARLLSTRHHVDLFDAQRHIGGHAQTCSVEAYGSHYDVDVGFMVFNHRTYPNFCQLLEILRVPSQPSDMSFSVRCQSTGFEYQGSSLNGLFAQRRNLLRPGFYRMVADILRFNRLARSFVHSASDTLLLGEFLDRHGFAHEFTRSYLLPMSAAIWSARPEDIPKFPARFILGFLENHGLLQVRDRPQWKTVAGRSAAYVQALLNPIREHVFPDTPVRSVLRRENEVTLDFESQPRRTYDRVVLACHADRALALLGDPSASEQEILGCFPYQGNRALLHTDPAAMPSRRHAWASWNYHIPDDLAGSASVTYDLNRLQQLGAPGPICVSLNPTFVIEANSILAEFQFQHPVFSTAAISAQRRNREISGQHHTYYCGAYWGYGFHEDGVNSALEVANQFGITMDDLRRNHVPSAGGSCQASNVSFAQG